MGLYIKQATMPKSCWTCELGMLQELSACPFYAFNTVEQDKYKEVRHPECPLIEVPENTESLEEEGITDEN